MSEVDENVHTYRSAVWLWRIISPIFMVFGTFGNILTIIVLTRHKSKISSTSVFLSALAISDLTALHAGLLRQWITYSFDVDVRVDLTEVGCKFHWFVVYFVTQFSSWMLVCVTVERFLSTWLPHRRTVACNTKTAQVTVSLIAVCLIAFNSHYLFGYGTKEETIGNTTTSTRCVPLTKQYEQFIIYEWTWIDLCVFYLIPLSILVTGNCAIVYKVLDSQRKSRRTAPLTTSITVSTISSTEQRVPKKTKTSSLTLTLVVVSAVFVVCITPIVVYPIGEPHWNKNASSEKLAELFWWETVANLMMYANHAVNFVLYFLSGSKFRNEVKRIICRKRINNESTLQHSRSGTMFPRT